MSERPDQTRYFIFNHPQDRFTFLKTPIPLDAPITRHTGQLFINSLKTRGREAITHQAGLWSNK